MEKNLVFYQINRIHSSSVYRKKAKKRCIKWVYVAKFLFYTCWKLADYGLSVFHSTHNKTSLLDVIFLRIAL